MWLWDKERGVCRCMALWSVVLLVWHRGMVMTGRSRATCWSVIHCGLLYIVVSTAQRIEGLCRHFTSGTGKAL